MTASWIATVAICIGAFAYAMHIGRKEERRRRERTAAAGMTFDSMPKDMRREK